jgi:hypothetical protein
MAKIKLDVCHMTIDDEIACLGPIVTKMTANSAFTTLATKTTALGTAVTALNTANADHLAAAQTAAQKLTVREAAPFPPATRPQEINCGKPGRVAPAASSPTGNDS